MKMIKRFCFGMASSILFAIGMGRAAEQLDPTTRVLMSASLDAPLSAAEECGQYPTEMLQD